MFTKWLLVSCYGCSTVSFSDCKKSWPWWLIAIVIAVCVPVGLLGYGVAQGELASTVVAPPGLELLAANDFDKDADNDSVVLVGPVTIGSMSVSVPALGYRISMTGVSALVAALVGQQRPESVRGCRSADVRR